MTDDIFVYGCDQEEHDNRFIVVLEHLKQAGVTSNKDKCSFSADKVTFWVILLIRQEYILTQRRLKQYS